MRRASPRLIRLALAVACSAGCGAHRAYVDAAFVPHSPVTASYRLLLIGDAGEHREPEPVLTALAVMAGRMAGRTTTVFLGDNAYPKGISGSARRQAEARATLARLADSATPASQAVFLAGNHDWAGYGRGGVDAVAAQAAFVRGRGATFLPQPGCSGPEVLDLPADRPVVRVVALDTQWWLHAHERGAGCVPDSRAGFVDALRQTLDTSLPVVVAGHHPLASHGEHGGYIDWKTHVFPLRSIPGMRWAWLPLPGLGSIYPLGRRVKRHEQDLNGVRNTDMRAAIGEALRGARRPPIIVYASGHDHAQQVLHGPDGVDYALVTGGGSSRNETAVGRGSDTLVAYEAAGFMALDIGPDGLSLAIADATDPASWGRWYPLGRRRE